MSPLVPLHPRWIYWNLTQEQLNSKINMRDFRFSLQSKNTVTLVKINTDFFLDRTIII